MLYKIVFSKGISYTSYCVISDSNISTLGDQGPFHKKYHKENHSYNVLFKSTIISVKELNCHHKLHSGYNHCNLSIPHPRRCISVYKMILSCRMVEDRTIHEVRQTSPEGEGDDVDVDTCRRAARHRLLLHHREHPTEYTE